MKHFGPIALAAIMALFVALTTTSAFGMTHVDESNYRLVTASGVVFQVSEFQLNGTQTVDHTPITMVSVSPGNHPQIKPGFYPPVFAVDKGSLHTIDPEALNEAREAGTLILN
jgi:hypothetical protein